MSGEVQKRKGRVRKIFRNRKVQAVLVVVIGYLIICAGFVVSAALPARAAQSSLNQAVSGLDAESVRSGETEEQLRNASNNLDSATNRLGSPVLVPLKAVPLVGHQVSTAENLTNAGSVAANVTLDTLAQVKELDMSDRVGALNQISEITNVNDQRLREVELGSKNWLVPPLADAREAAVENLNRLDSGLVRSSAASAGMAQMLGTDGQYLLIAANNAEMRNGSGMWLQAGLLRARNGSLEVGEMRSVADVTQPDNSVAWPEDLNTNWGFLGRRGDMRNLMLSPRFETSASLAKRIWEADGQPRVDGVIAMDVKMIQSLLKVTGPVQVNGTRLNADNAEKALLFDQYQAIEPGNASSQDARRDGLSDVAGAVFNKFLTSNWEPVSAARNLSEAASGRHVMMWSADGQRQALWYQAGLSGDVELQDTMVSLVNLGTNKLDQFMDVSSEMSTRRKGDVIETTIDVEVKNNAPEQGPRYVLGPADGVPQNSGDYLGFLAFTLPHDSVDVTFGNDNTRPTVYGRDGGNVVAATNVQMGRGQAFTFTIKFSRPDGTEFTNMLPSARIPSVSWAYGDEKWSDKASQRVTY